MWPNSITRACNDWVHHRPRYACSLRDNSRMIDLMGSRNHVHSSVCAAEAGFSLQTTLSCFVILSTCFCSIKRYKYFPHSHLVGHHYDQLCHTNTTGRRDRWVCHEVFCDSESYFHHPEVPSSIEKTPSHCNFRPSKSIDTTGLITISLVETGVTYSICWLFKQTLLIRVLPVLLLVTISKSGLHFGSSSHETLSRIALLTDLSCNRRNKEKFRLVHLLQRW